jgi:hypothetical protein
MKHVIRLGHKWLAEVFSDGTLAQTCFETVQTLANVLVLSFRNKLKINPETEIQ